MIAFLLLAAAAGCLLTELIASRRSATVQPLMRLGTSTSREWALAFAITALASGGMVQTWFHPGTVIAGGDVTPPVGSLDFANVFNAWLPGNLGAPNSRAGELPFAAIVGAISHTLGGTGLGQRVFYTLLFVGAGASALALLRVLGVRPVPATVGALLYILNPYVLSEVGFNPVFIAALVLLPALPACILAAGRNSIPWNVAICLLGLSAPLVGYAYENPPLVLMLIAAIFAAPAFGLALYGRQVAQRSLIVAAAGGSVMLAVSAYWIVPSVFQLHDVASSQLSTLSAWSWTEQRATLANAFWLNTIWSWNFAEYLPIASSYSAFPLSLARFLLPITAFAALGLARTDGYFNRRAAKIAAGTALGALILVLFSTGTNFPGSIVFDPLYSFPLGWLLREPGRFLMAAALGYSILAVLTIGMVGDRIGFMLIGRFAKFRLAARQRPLRILGATAIATGALVIGGVASFPIANGEVVPDNRPLLPPLHVSVPSYWPEMATAIDSSPVSGSVIVLPEDDFYQMPYTWGFYGDDGFISQLISRPVIDPVANGYTPAPPQLRSAISLLSQSLLDQNSLETLRLMDLLRAPFVLVRGDIDASFPGRDITPPTDLDTALRHSPNFRLVRRVGELALYQLTSPMPPLLARNVDAVTINTPTPDLRLLQALAAGQAIVDSPPKAGVPSITQLDFGAWTQTPGHLDEALMESADRTYQLILLKGNRAASVVPTAASTLNVPGLAVSESVAASGTKTLTLNLATGPNLLETQTFDAGWALGDCNDLLPITQTGISRSVMPKAGPMRTEALELRANLDIGCVYKGLSDVAPGASMMISLYVRHISGAPPRLCLWQIDLNSCAPLPDLPLSSTWQRYVAIVQPPPQAHSFALYLYADSDPSSSRTVNDYSAVNIVKIPGAYDFALFGQPIRPDSSVALDVLHQNSDSQWVGTPTDDGRTTVDGLLLGWLRPARDQVADVRYTPATTVALAQVISAISASACLAIATFASIRWISRRPRRRT
jgi:arabinofuranan 3-O-arabinosyltransferase